MRLPEIMTPGSMAGSRGGGVLGVTGSPPPPPPPSIAIYKCRSIRISFRLGGLRSMKMKMAIPSFFLGGGGGGGREGGVRGSRNLGGGSASFKLLTTKGSQKLYYAVFLFIPLPGFLDPPLGSI